MEDFDKHVLTLQMFFLNRGYPMPLLEEASLLARNKDRLDLLTNLNNSQNPGVNGKIFLITTFHPTDPSLRQIVFKNWDLLRKSPTTSFLHQKKKVDGRLQETQKLKGVSG